MRTNLKFLWIVEWDVHHMNVWNFSITVSLKSTRKKKLANRLKLTGISDNALRTGIPFRCNLAGGACPDLPPGQHPRKPLAHTVQPHYPKPQNPTTFWTWVYRVHTCNVACHG